MMPIIKKWLYSDKDIFLREIVANGIDAITKFKKLVGMGEAQEDGNEYCVKISVDKKAKTLTVEDNGIGMTEEEVESYITQIAFSGASDFIKKYESEGGDGIIGHFGLGFYSVYMVSENVEIFTKSYKDAPAVHWESDGNATYSIEENDKSTRGTKIIMHIAAEEKEFLDENNIKNLVRKYCSFMPFNVYVNYKGDGKDEPLNSTLPLYAKNPKDCTDEEYKKFYTDTFMDYNDPIFWVHLNMDYPFNLKGILYFPKINTEYDSIEGTIKLYNNQVFIADNIKEVIPEFLMLLKGVIDCPDLPLNVSRSALQNDGFVKKISEYITKKVADKLTGMCKTQREDYESYWDDISPFIKFGCIKDDKFSEKMMDYILFKNLDDKYLTLKDCIEKNEKPEDKEKADPADTGTKTDADSQSQDSDAAEGGEDVKKTTIFYVTDPVQQSQYINLFKEQGLDAVHLQHNIDNAFISHMERLNDKIKFQRIDADMTDEIVEDAADEETAKTLTDLFRKELGKEDLQVKVENLKNENISSMMTLEEESRRMQEMMKMYSMGGMGDPSMFGGKETLVLNAKNALVRYLAAHQDSEHTHMLCEQLYDLAMISHKPLDPEAMTKFIARSNEIMMLLTK